MESKDQKRLIVVEDSVSVREAVVFALSRSGYDVLSASNGLEAMVILERNRIDLLLTDYHMPEMNGLDLIRWVRQKKIYKHLPILVLTTEGQRDVIMEARNAGATGWIQKPFAIEKLVQTIRRFIR